MRLVSICATLLVLGGCASQPAATGAAPTAATGAVPTAASGASAPVVVANAAPDAKPKLVCHKESAIGSNMIHTVCEPEPTAAEQQKTHDWLMNNVRPRAQNHAAGG